MSIRKEQGGFTLIELIVVVTIIAVLTVMAIVSYAGSSKKSRDGRRQADLEKIRIALELFRQEKGYYPENNTDLVSEKYLQSWPIDPKGGFTYYYVRGGTSYTYSLGAQMEDLGSTNASTLGNDCSGPCNYEVKNP